MHFLKLNDVVKYKQTFEFLENYQKNFKYSTSDDRYRWSKSPLREWSRCCEYPFIYETVKKYAKDGSRILDFGSGKNFLPILLSEEGFKVTCLDIDDYSQFYNNNSINGRYLDFQTDIGRLSEKFDVVYSVSVLEHTPNILIELDSIKTRLSDNGLLVLTLDIDIRGDLSISMDKLTELITYLASNYIEIDTESVCDDTLLTYRNSPYGFWHQSPIFIIRRVLRSIYNNLTNKPDSKRWIMPYDLRVGLFVGKKRI
jgi:2-polyprenyl-3-methyl-5-hydroxy-6-metoxy-1,4-benzoquinol methylase